MPDTLKKSKQKLRYIFYLHVFFLYFSITYFVFQFIYEL